MTKIRLAQGQLPDVLIAATMRSGGTWASHIAHQVLANQMNPDSLSDGGSGKQPA